MTVLRVKNRLNDIFDVISRKKKWQKNENLVRIPPNARFVFIAGGTLPLASTGTRNGTNSPGKHEGEDL